MSQWPSVKAKRLLAALLRIGWSVKRQSGSHKTLTRPDWPDFAKLIAPYAISYQHDRSHRKVGSERGKE